MAAAKLEFPRSSASLSPSYLEALLEAEVEERDRRL
jgi:hypothetical protein